MTTAKLFCILVLLLSVAKSQEIPEDDYDVEFQASLPSTRQASNDKLYPTVFTTITIPKYTPTPFKPHATTYLNALEKALKGKVDVSIVGLQGEDHGTGVHTRVTFLDGGIAAAEKFRTKTVPDWNQLGKIFPNKTFGAGVHAEAISHPCLVQADGTDPPEQAGLTPTLLVAVALMHTSPKNVTNAIIKNVVNPLQQLLLPETSTVKVDWFIDDNLEVGINTRKPVFNIAIQGPSKESLSKVVQKINKIQSKALKPDAIWNKSTGLTGVHVEGGRFIPRICIMQTSNAVERYMPEIKKVVYAIGNNTAELEVVPPVLGKRPLVITAVAHASTSPIDDRSVKCGQATANDLVTCVFTDLKPDVEYTFSTSSVDSTGKISPEALPDPSILPPSAIPPTTNGGGSGTSPTPSPLASPSNPTPSGSGSNAPAPSANGPSSSPPSLSLPVVPAPTPAVAPSSPPAANAPGPVPPSQPPSSPPAANAPVPVPSSQPPSSPPAANAPGPTLTSQSPSSQPPSSPPAANAPGPTLTSQSPSSQPPSSPPAANVPVPSAPPPATNELPPSIITPRLIPEIPDFTFTDDEEFDPKSKKPKPNPENKPDDGFGDPPTCIGTNEWYMEQDTSASPRYGMQMIPSLGAWNKPNYDNTPAIQQQYIKAVFNKIASMGIRGTALRIFNTDNSQAGVGVHTRIWFLNSADCQQFINTVKSNAALQSFLPSSPFGTATLRMITQHKCHKWKIPATFVAQSDFANFTPAAVTPPNPPNIAQTQIACTSFDDDSDPGNPPNNRNAHALQVIVSFGALTKTSFINSTNAHNLLKSSWENYFRAQKSKLYSSTIGSTSGNGIGVILEIKAVDNSAAGAGVHMRLYFDNSQDCSALANVLKNYPGEGDQNDVYLAQNIFTNAAFGDVTRRMASRSCHPWKSPTVPSTPAYFATSPPYKSAVTLQNI